MRLDQVAEAAFARHESFHPRYGWVKKAYDAAVRDPKAFLAEDAPVALGVGKNMVRAIRHWGLATKVIAAAPDPDRPRTLLAHPTGIGVTLLDGEIGWDPYGEHPGTLWLLHWWLCAPVSVAPVWWSLLNQFSALEFDEDAALRSVDDHVHAAPGWDPHPSSVKKDVQCFLRMYATHELGVREQMDDLVDSPFRTLNLLAVQRTAEGGRRYRFHLGDKPTLPPAVVAFAALDYAARVGDGISTMPVSRLANDPGSPGRVFRLTEGVLVSLLEAAAAQTTQFTVSSSVGLIQISWEDDPAQAAAVLLHEHYQRWRSGVPGTSFWLAGPKSGTPLSEADLRGAREMAAA